MIRSNPIGGSLQCGLVPGKDFDASKLDADFVKRHFDAVRNKMVTHEIQSTTTPYGSGFTPLSHFLDPVSGGALVW